MYSEMTSGGGAFKSVLGNYEYSLAAGASVGCNPLDPDLITIPSGYTAIAIQGYATNSQNVLMSNCILANNQYGLFFKNFGSGNEASRLQWRVLCVRNDSNLYEII